MMIFCSMIHSTQNTISRRKFVFSALRRVIVNYISSHKTHFLRSIRTYINQSDFGSLLRKLTFINTFVSNILFSQRIHVDENIYLLPHSWWNVRGERLMPCREIWHAIMFGVVFHFFFVCPLFRVGLLLLFSFFSPISSFWFLIL